MCAQTCFCDTDAATDGGANPNICPKAQFIGTQQAMELGTFINCPNSLQDETLQNRPKCLETQ